LPELPEIEVIRRTLAPLVEGRTLAVRGVGPHDMRARGEGRGGARKGRAWMTPRELLDGARVERLERRGKRLAVVARDGRTLVVQLGMSGQLLASADAGEDQRHVTWSFASRAPLLCFRDPRRFGGLTAYPDVRSMHAAWDAELGPDALTVRAEELVERLRGARAVKAALLDQTVLAGVGNIYADESLHLAGIDPRTRCDRIDGDRVSLLARSIRTILERAVRTGGSTLRDYRSARGDSGGAQQLHAVYGRAGQPCLRCGAALVGSRLAGRATVRCPGCQRRKA
jgi:formamidopyrimidine-DNA glycosylase